MSAAPAVIGRTSLFLSDVDRVSASEITESLRKFYADFPEIAPHLSDVTVSADEFAESPHAYAVTKSAGDVPFGQSDEFHIVLNAGFYGHGHRARLTRMVREDFHQYWHAYPHANGVFEHELGHVLDMQLARANALGLPPSYALEYEDAHTISEYAMRGGPQEAFADAFANLRMGVSPGNGAVRRVLDGAISLANRAAA